MPKYKITRVYIVEAQSKPAAKEQVKSGQAEEYLVYEAATEVTEPKKGWLGEVRKQLTGK